MVSDSVQEEARKGHGTKTGTEEPEAGKGRTETGKGARDAEVASLQKMALRSAIESLRRICFVLGISYSKKLLEMGVTSDEELDLSRVQNQIDELSKTLEANYKRIKDIGVELLAEWEISETPFKRMMTFSHIISVSDSTSSSDVQDAEFLSTLYLKRAQKELNSLQTERLKEAKKEYEKEKKKLKEMVAENHITWESVGFDPQRKANSEKYTEELLEVQKSITKAKRLAFGRRELIFRVERVRQLIDQNKLPFSTTRAFLENAKVYVDSQSSDAEAEIVYDGENVYAILEKFKALIDELEDKKNKQFEKELQRASVRTRESFRSLSNPSHGPSTHGEDETEASAVGGHDEAS